MIDLFKGKSIDAIDSIERLISFAEKQGKLSSLKEKFFCERCETFLAVGMYHEAIEAATKAIEKNPTNRSIITLDPSKLEELIKRHAGTGQYISGEIGFQGYKERVEFGQVIGECALMIEGKPVQYHPVTRGIITYTKDGKAHVYPANPNSW